MRRGLAAPLPLTRQGESRSLFRLPTRAIKILEEIMKLNPLNDRVLVKRLESEEKTAGGLFIPDSA